MRVAAVSLVLAAGCTHETGLEVAASFEPTLDRRVLVIGIDGLRADIQAAAETPALDRLRDEGLYTGRAQTQRDARLMSGPGWASVLSGVGPDQHRVRSNFGLFRMDRAYPTFLEVAAAWGYDTAVAAKWYGIFRLLEDDAASASFHGPDRDALDATTTWLSEADYAVHMVVFNELDAAGHRHGFHPDVPEYVSALEAIDRWVDTLQDAIDSRPRRDEESWLTLIATDHGGDWWGHGRDRPEIRTIPLLLHGDGIAPGVLPDEGVTHYDVAPSVLDWLDIPWSPVEARGQSRISATGVP